MSLYYPKVILFGDALTQTSFSNHNNINSWGAALSHKLSRKCDVFNRGFAGYNTEMAKQILPELISKNMAIEVAVLVIFFGSNDAIFEEQSPKQHVPVEDYKLNLKEMAQYLLTVSILREKIILVTPPPVDDDKWEKECKTKGIPIDRKNSVHGDYSKACCAAAKDYGIDLLDLWTLMQKEKNWQSFLSDGVNLSPEGIQFLSKHLTEKIETRTDSVPIKFPYFRDISNVPESKREQYILDNKFVHREESKLNCSIL
ncbi:isoamyl acetate-hydrolyzing esterase 1 homolog [Glandiceps talaboti]